MIDKLDRCAAGPTFPPPFPFLHMTSAPDTPMPTEALSPDDFDQIDNILDDLRSRFDETPQWEFCEGFMAALVCCRRVIPASEYLPVLLDIGTPDEPGEGSFASAEQAEAFMALWGRRWNEVVAGLDAKVDRLDDEAAYHPEVMDVRGAIAQLPEAERADMEGQDLPSFGQVWAVGFMYAVEAWPDEWTPPRDRDAAKALDQCLHALVALTEDDEDEPTLSVFSDDGPPSVSESRFDAFAEAVWAVYDLRELWRSIGPRVETVVKAPEPGRNDPCTCGSGKKYKKCCGAG
ncbi:MAG: hypothetical protein RL459_1373 [Pseudomonadota bacterium]